MSETVESKELLLIKFRDRELRAAPSESCGCRDAARRCRLQRLHVRLLRYGRHDADWVNLSRATFTRVDLRRAQLDRGLLKRTQFTDCNLTEVDMQRALLDDVRFERCDMDNAGLRSRLPR